MVLITFSGLDGSGKSTLSILTQKILHDNFKIISKIYWIKFGDIGISITNDIKKSTIIKSDNPYKLELDNYRNILYFWFIIIIHWICINIIKIKILMGQSIILDRYFYDTIVDICVNFNYDYNKTKHIIKNMFGIPKPDISFYIDVDEEVAYNRKTDFYSIKYLMNRKRIYEYLVNDYDLIKLNGIKDIKSLEKDILIYLSKLDVIK